MTGGDTIGAEIKGGEQFDTLFKGSLIIACNEKPKLDGDNGKHMYERVLLIPCNNVIPKHKQDPNLFENMKQDTEYIFFIAMTYLQQLIANEYKFTYSDVIERELYEYQIQDDGILQWLNSDMVGFDSKSQCKGRELYRSYKAYCEGQGIKDFKKGIELTSRLKQLGYEIGKQGNSSVYGIRILE
jgi:phage/plasmid-associated DNA primase